MAHFDNIREFFAQRTLRKLARQESNPTRFSYATSKTIGIVYNANNTAETRAALELYNKLKGEGKTVSTLGYLPVNRKNTTIHPKLGFDYFYRSDLDWQLAPKNGIVDTFVNTPFGLLIDLTTTPIKPLNFVVAYSKASIKAGKMNNGEFMLYDFMIGGILNENIDTFATQVIHYLKLLNS